jgi:hypothetical protein
MKIGGFPTIRRVLLLGSTSSLVLVAAMPSVTVIASPAMHASHAQTSKNSQIAQVRAIVRGLGVQPPRKTLGKGKVREPLFSQYLLRTRVAQKASLSFIDGTVLQINQRTDAVLTSPGATKVKNGEVDQIMQPGTKHQVKTATATASAIGTNWDTKCSKASCAFSVAEGAVKVSARVRVHGKIKIFSVIVKTGQQTTVRRGQRPSKPKSVDVRKILGWTTSLPPAPASLGQNIGLDANGGSVVGVTSTRVDTKGTWDAHHIIDGKPTSGWQSAPGQTSNQIVDLTFAHGSVFHIYGIVIDPAATGKQPASDDLKDFQVQLSIRGSAYTTVFSGQTAQRATLQRFTFSGSHDADHVRLILESNWGGPDGIAVSEVEIVGSSDSGPVGVPLPTPTPTGSGSKLGMTGSWTYFSDSKTIVFAFASAVTGSAKATRRLSARSSRAGKWVRDVKQQAVARITVKGVPVARGVQFQGFGAPLFNFGVSGAELNAAPASQLTAPYPDEFGFTGTGVPAASVKPAGVYEAVFTTSSGKFTVKLLPAVRQGETSFLQNMLATVYSPGWTGTRRAPTSVILPASIGGSLSSAGQVQDGLPINTTGSPSGGNYALKFPQGAPTYDGFAIYGVSRPAVSLPFMLFLGSDSRGDQLPVITRPATVFHEIYGNRVVSADTYSPVATPPFCPANLPTSGNQPKYDVINFSGNHFTVSPAATGGSLTGTVTLDGVAHAAGAISNYSISWDARLAPDGTGIGSEQLTSGGCSVSVPFSVRPDSISPSARGSATLKPSPSSLTLRAKVGSASNPSTVSVTNSGSTNVTVLAVHLAGDSRAFTLGDGNCYRGISIPAGQTCDLAVTFDAYSPGPSRGAIAIDYMIGGKVKTATVKLSGNQTQSQAQVIKVAVDVLLKQINIDRGKTGARPLVLDPAVSRCATNHSKQMALANNLSHNDAADICVRHTQGAENVAEDPTQPVSKAVLKMEGSFVAEGPCAHNPCTPGDLVNHSHYAFLMKRVFTRVGIGVYVKGHETWLTEDYFTP